MVNKSSEEAHLWEGENNNELITWNYSQGCLYICAISTSIPDPSLPHTSKCIFSERRELINYTYSSEFSNDQILSLLATFDVGDFLCWERFLAWKSRGLICPRIKWIRLIFSFLRYLYFIPRANPLSFFPSLSLCHRFW